MKNVVNLFMLRGEDLRIGNWLLRGTPDESEQVYTKIDDLDISRIYCIDDTFRYYPIPLTQKLLKKIGADFVTYVKPGVVKYQDTEISYLHTLQNLYYALKQKELIIPKGVFKSCV